MKDIFLPLKFLFLSKDYNFFFLSSFFSFVGDWLEKAVVLGLFTDPKLSICASKDQKVFLK